ncbi:pentatricopeptide repeat-containing protein At4g21880, mitochondrial-like isoform X1 [Asparagus officinalis]|nr:pentatricopeptide repeat-containing protein At4g21880, mitochondrial-like isoform X1 [Asparagus officinalis]
MMASLTPKNILDSSWFANGEIFDAQQRKELSRNRKQKFLFKGTESYKFTKLMRNCATKFGPDYTLEVFGRIGRETGIKDYNALIKHCIVKARQSNGEASSVQIGKIYQLFVSMRESGFPIEEASFGPFFEYMIDMKMVEEFQIFSELIKDANPESYSRIGYYEMLLSIRVGDEDKIHELCNPSGVASSEECYNLAVSYLLAFCDTDRKDELLQLLEVVDILSISSLKYLSSIFRSLGRLQCEKLMKKFILALKTSEDGEKNVSPLIYEYVSSIPNLEVEEIISKFSNLHKGLEVCPSIVSCEMLIKICCTSSKIRAAVEVIELICQSGLDIPDHFFDPLLHACERSCEFDMVRPIYSVMSRHNVRPKEKTFKSLISLCVRMKDFEGAYNLLADAKEIEGVPTTRMYNAIMAGYCRGKNFAGALMVLKQMEHADVQPDSETYSYLIANCERQEDVFKYHNEMKLGRIEKTKYVYMSFINAYAKFRNFELAKQVLLDSEIQPKYLNELKNVLVASLSSNGQITDALQLYDEIKQAGCTTEPKTVISLIEHIQSDGKLDRLLRLLEELNDSSFWFDGCSRVILYCVRYHFVNSAIGLLKKLKEKDETSTCFVIDKMYCQIWELGPTHLEAGLELLRAIKEELHLRPSRTSLDFLLSSCVTAKDPHHAQLVWSEYEDAGLSYNVLTFLRMYEALLVSGQRKKASKLLKKIEKDDPHVNYIIKSCKETFMKPSSA